MAARYDLRPAFEEWFKKERTGFEPHMLARFEDKYMNLDTYNAYCAWYGAVQWIIGLGAIKWADAPPTNEDR